MGTRRWARKAGGGRWGHREQRGTLNHKKSVGGKNPRAKPGANPMTIGNMRYSISRFRQGVSSGVEEIEK